MCIYFLSSCISRILQYTSFHKSQTIHATIDVRNDIHQTSLVNATRTLVKNISAATNATIQSYQRIILHQYRANELMFCTDENNRCWKKP